MLRIDVDCFGYCLTAYLAMTKKGGDCHGLQGKPRNDSRKERVASRNDSRGGKGFAMTRGKSYPLWRDLSFCISFCTGSSR